MNTKTVGQRVAQARIARGLNLTKIAVALDTSVEWLLGGPDSDEVPRHTQLQSKAGQNAGMDEAPPYSDLEHAIATLRKLPPERLKEALTFIQYLSAKQNTPSSDGADNSISAPRSGAL